MLRFAPSPTGDMHIDNLRVAIINYLIAQQQNDTFLIRIQDIDKADNIEGKDTEIMQILEKFALKHDSVYHQSEHLHMHQTLAIKLLEQEKAFVCTCTPQELEGKTSYSGCCENKDKAEHAKLKESGDAFVIRLKKPQGSISYHDRIQGDITATAEEVDAFVILREDSTPSYDFASACDDMLSGISTVIRSESYLMHTPRQEHIKAELGYSEETLYSHLPSMENNVSLISLFEQGFVPDAIINYLLCLGNPNAPKEIFTLPDALEWFELETLTSTVCFDIEALRAINREHLMKVEDLELSKLFGFADADIGKLAKLYLQEFATIQELEVKIKAIFSPKDFEGTCGDEMKILAKAIYDAPMIDEYEAFTAYLTQTTGLKEESLLKPLSLLLTATEDEAALSAIYPLIKSYLLELVS